MEKDEIINIRTEIIENINNERVLSLKIIIDRYQFLSK